MDENKTQIERLGEILTPLVCLSRLEIYDRLYDLSLEELRSIRALFSVTSQHSLFADKVWEFVLDPVIEEKMHDERWKTFPQWRVIEGYIDVERECGAPHVSEIDARIACLRLSLENQKLHELEGREIKSTFHVRRYIEPGKHDE